MQGSLHCLVLTLCKSTAGSVRGFQQAAPRHTIYISLLKPTFKFEKPGTLFLRWSSTSASAESASKLSVHLPRWSNLTSWHVGRCPVQTNEGLLEVPLEGCPGAREVTGANCFQSPLSNFFTEKFWSYCCISHLCRCIIPVLFQKCHNEAWKQGTNHNIHCLLYLSVSSLPPFQHPCIPLQYSDVLSATLSLWEMSTHHKHTMWC